MREGHIVQTGEPDELWAHPADADVARFLGLGNVGDGRIVRPEAVAVRRAMDGAGGDGVVESAVRHGPTVRLVVRLDDGSVLEAAVVSVDHPAPGERVSVEIDPAGVVPVPESPC
jgi:ABC-type Fe3+/spermidine/putrescine transport system ATPase subunit